MLAINVFVALGVKDKYEETRKECEECWNYSTCVWNVQIVYNDSETYNFTYDDLSAMGEGQG